MGDIWKLNPKIDGLVCCKAAVVSWKFSKTYFRFKQIKLTLRNSGANV